MKGVWPNYFFVQVVNWDYREIEPPFRTLDRHNHIVDIVTINFTVGIKGQDISVGSCQVTWTQKVLFWDVMSMSSWLSLDLDKHIKKRDHHFHRATLLV